MGRTKRWALLVVAALLALSGAMALIAQPPPRGPSIRDFLHRHGPHQPSDSERLATPVVPFDASHLGSPVQLDKGWRVGVTVNPDAANPDFDDSTWAVRDAGQVITDIPNEDPRPGPHPNAPPGSPDDHEGPNISVNGNPIESRRGQRFAWFRMHIELAPDHGPLAFYVELPISQNTSMGSSAAPGVEVFANGQKIRPEGPHSDQPQRYQPISRIYNLPIGDDETSLVLVLRTPFIPVGSSTYTAFFTGHNLRLGHHEDLDRARDLWSARNLFERLPRLIVSILLLVLALFLLALYFSQKGHPEYLWLALHELFQAPIGFIDLAGSSAHVDQLWYASLLIQSVFISAYLYFEFLISFLSLRRRWYTQLMRYTAPVMLAVGPALLFVEHGGFIAIVLVGALILSFLWVITWALFVFITLILATIRRNFEAGLLLIPLVLSIIGVLEPVLTSGMNTLGSATYHSPLTIQAGPIPIHFASIADFAGLFVIVLIIFVRFLRIQQQQQRVSSELAAARSVQELMIPQEKLETPGFEVDSIYNPAAEVGGDFFHVEVTREGGLLVVIGDVAGKGLRAAMNVSMLMGALRRTPDRSPAKILESLNRVLVGSDSFTTCQAAYFGPNGELVLSNAGHLPPYLNSQEIALPGGLPLGVLADNSYEEVRLYLHPGDRILLMSDGVVEARTAAGELFGFDRVHNLSNQSAFYIADAAKSFGQEDDITVLTVRRLAQAMAA